MWSRLAWLHVGSMQLQDALQGFLRQLAADGRISYTDLGKSLGGVDVGGQAFLEAVELVGARSGGGMAFRRLSDCTMQCVSPVPVTAGTA